MTTPELSRMVKVRALPSGDITIEADERERAALARRFELSALPMLEATLRVDERDDAILVDGELRAKIEQPCVITREDFTYSVSELLSLRFVPAAADRIEHEEEIELTADELDEIEYDGDAFDIGEAIAQTLGLAIDPYREGPGAEAARQDAGIVADDEALGPLAEALQALRKS